MLELVNSKSTNIWSEYSGHLRKQTWIGTAFAAMGYTSLQVQYLVHLQGHQRAASEDFPLEVLWKQCNPTLREWEKKVEVSQPRRNDPQGPDLEKPRCNWELAHREQMPLGNSTIHKRSQCQKARFSCQMQAPCYHIFRGEKKENPLEIFKYKCKSQ